MVPLPESVKAEIGKCGSEKTDYRNPLVSKLTRSITFSYVDSDTGFGIPRYPYAFSVEGITSLLSKINVSSAIPGER